MRTFAEEFEHVVTTEGEAIKNRIILMIETQIKATGKPIIEERKKELIEHAVKMNITEIALSRKIDEIVNWINKYENKHMAIG